MKKLTVQIFVLGNINSYELWGTVKWGEHPTQDTIAVWLDDWFTSKSEAVVSDVVWVRVFLTSKNFVTYVLPRSVKSEPETKQKGIDFLEERKKMQEKEDEDRARYERTHP